MIKKQEMQGIEVTGHTRHAIRDVETLNEGALDEAEIVLVDLPRED